jgi:hypothetical protein
MYHAFHSTCFILCFIFLLLCFESYSQSVEWSQPKEEKDKNSFVSVLGQNEGGIYTLRQNYRDKRKNIIIDYYTRDLKFQFGKVCLTHRDDYLLQVVVVKKGVEVFYSSYNKVLKKTEILVRCLNTDLSEKANKDTVLFSTDIRDPNFNYLQVFQQRLSPFTLILVPKEDNNHPQSYTYLLLDSNLRSYKTGEVSVSIKEPYMPEQVVYDNQCISLLLRTEKSDNRGRIEYHYQIAYGNYNIGNLNSQLLYGDGFYTEDGLMKYDTVNKKIVYAGIYYESDSDDSKGYYIAGINPRTLVFNGKKHPFSYDLIAETNGKNVHEKGLYDYQFNDLVLRKDGGVILLLEEVRTSREAIGDIAIAIIQSGLKNYFYFDNIVTISLNSKGEEDWYKVLRKDQVSSGDNGIYSSYLLHVQKSKIYLVFNDLSRQRWTLSYIALNPDGSSQTDILIKPQDYDGNLIPRNGQEVSQNTFIIPGNTPKGQVLMRVRF